ncbi:MAG TPA: hypothetical protein VHQ00_07035, partial [Chloroflexota bacterium]|nr:hypothetical protein [Chloroflexota bacterium]
AERERLEGRRQAAAGACAEAEQELQLAGATVEGAGQQAAAALAELQSAGAGGGAGEDAGAERSLQEARRKAGDAARAVTQVTTQLRELERQQEGFERQVVEAAEGQDRAARSLEQTGSRLAGLEQAGSAAQERLARAQGARAEAAQARAEAQGRLETLTARAATLDREAEGLRARLDVLDSLLRSGDRKAKRPEASDQGGQRLASRLQVPGHLEAAVAAAAGAALEWELVPTLGEARRRALALAADGERTTFVATERLALAPANGAPGSLYEAVSREAPPDSAETDLLRRTVLGQFDLAPDLDAALAALEEGSRPAVTRKGEAVSPQGVSPLGTVTAGAPPGQATLLQRVRQRRDAAGLLESSLAARAALEAPLSETRERLRTLTEAERRLEGETRTLAQQVSREEGERRALSQQLARLEGDVRWWGEFATRAGAQRASLAERLATLKAQDGETQQRHAQATRDVQDLTAAAQRRQARLARLREDERAARTALSLAQGRLDQARQRRAAAVAAADAAQSDLRALLARAEQARQTVTSLRQQEPERAQRVTALEAEGGTGAQRGDALRAATARERARQEEAALAARKARDELAGAQARSAALQERRTALAEREETLLAQALRELGELPPPVPGPNGADGAAPLRAEVEALERRLHGMGPVNQVALQEHAEASERLTFLKQQLDDLNGAAAALAAARAELDAGLEADFTRTFEAVAEAFRGTFTRLFNGGEAELRLTDPGNVAETGVEILARLPGKRRQELALLSGGERALAACALLFALLEARPSPFCILDEVDAALDEANVGRFCDALEDLSQATQFVLITHNRATMERAGALYGVTLGEDGVSRVLSLRLADAVRLVGARNGTSPHTVHSVPPAPNANANAT